MDLPADEERQLALALHRLAPPTVQVGCRRISAADLAALGDVEAAHVRRAVRDRQLEFASGRVLLRRLLDHDGDIGVAADRSPLLPEGVRGSLAHDRRFAVAAVSRDPSVVAIGIDIEPVTPLEPEVAAVVLREDEQQIDAHLAFTMKEAAYKAWSSLGGRILDHGDVRLRVTGPRFQADIVADRTYLKGSWVDAAGRWIALVVVEEEHA